MEPKIESIYYFNYIKDIGYYDSFRNFQSNEIQYLGLALSTPKVRVNASPTEYIVNQDGSNIIKNYVSASLPTLCEISKEIAVHSSEYIMLCYDDGTDRYFKNDLVFCEIFNIAKKYQPGEESNSANYVSPFELQINSVSWTSPTEKTPVSTTAYKKEDAAIPFEMNTECSGMRLHKTTSSAKNSLSAKSAKTFFWKSIGKVLCLFALLYVPIQVITACLVFLIFDNSMIIKTLNIIESQYSCNFIFFVGSICYINGACVNKSRFSSCTASVKPNPDACYHQFKPHVPNRIHKTTKSSAVIVILSLLCIGLAGLNIVQSVNSKSVRHEAMLSEYRITELENVIKAKDSVIEQYKSQIKDIENNVQSKTAEAAFLNEHIVIVSDDGTNLYHKFGCTDLNLESFWAFNTEAAQGYNYTPCSKCCK